MKLLLVLFKVAAAVVFLLIVLLALGWWLGRRLPREHTASRTVVFSKTQPAAVWAVIADQAGQPAWRPDLKANVRLADQSGHEVWRNEMKSGDAITFEITEAVPGQRLVTRIVDNGGPFGGTWTFALEAAGDGSRLKITEDGWINPPLFRVVASYVIGLDATLKGYLDALTRRLGEGSVS